MAHPASPALTLARFLPAAQNGAARSALEGIIDAFAAGKAPALPHPLVLHGPPGVGKTHLVMGLINALTTADPSLVVQLQTTGDLVELAPTSRPVQFKNPELAPPPDATAAWCDAARRCDLLVLEDLQHLPTRLAEVVVQVLDARQADGRPTVVTANAGPRHLTLRGERLPARLASRLAGGLVVDMAPLPAPSRLRLLQEAAQRAQLAVVPEILDWLAEHLTGGGRQLEGAVRQLETLAKLQPRLLSLDDVRPHFQSQIDAARPSLGRIVERVGDCFAVASKHLQSRRRTRNVVLPRQVSMYLARRLTQHSLQEIGAFFGGHDHSTVLHACRKIETALDEDAVLSGTLRQLQSELT